MSESVLEGKFYEISMKGEKHLIQAKSRKEAFKKIFRDIVNEEISLSDVSVIMVAKDGGEEYPMRLIPSLYAVGKIDYETSMATLINIGVDLTYGEFMDTVEQDKWMWEG